MPKKAIKKLFSAIGFEIRRVDTRSTPPPNFQDPLEAMFHVNCGEPATFTCMLSDCVIFNGFSFDQKGWHPFVYALNEFRENRGREFEGSRLDSYYRAWQPADAAEALIGLTEAPEVLKRYPSFIKHVPWLNLGCEERLNQISRILCEENAGHGHPELGVRDGYGLHGPVSPAKGRLEYRRLTGLFEKIEREGFRCSGNAIAVQILKRGNEFRFWVAHGYHRTAVLKALGHEEFQAAPTMVVDVNEVDHWPQVYRGTWTRKQALDYFDHCFDFDAVAWARARGLTSYIST